jgi:DNA-binding SARP family transcriptional activator
MAYLLRGDASTALLCISEISSPEDHNIIDSYEYNVYTIAYGTVLLYQQRYEEACVFFTEKESAFDALNAHREHIQIKISLAFCRLALAQTEAFVACLEEITQFLSSHEGYKHPALVEIRRHSALLYAVETLPEAQTLRLLLKLENVSPPAAEITQRSVYAVAQPVEEHLTLKITALGEPAVIIQGKPISHWRMARAMELFFFFLHTGRPLRKEQILTALWPNIDEQTDHTLHTTIYYLRKTLGDNKCITTRGGTYALNLSACYGDLVWYDVDEFQQHHNNAQQALVQKKIPDARASLLAMINLYQGDYVPSIYSDWCNTRRDELRTLYLDARRSLGQIALHEKTYDESIIHWQHILALDTSQEEAHYGLMCCYTQQEKRGLAIRQYQQCKEILWQELGIEPGVAVKNLYRHLTGS